MSNIITDRLKTYNLDFKEDEVNAIKEILQEIILYGLSTLGFFEKALFQGGTALRILYGLPRFSEDLDFILKHPDTNFNWHTYLDGIHKVCEEFGVATTVIDKSKATTVVQKMFVKSESIGNILDFSFKHAPFAKVTIKVEVDTNPPSGSVAETKYLDYPLLYPIIAQDLPSNFACKLHALLCREYTKGRDWYDFLWYVARSTVPNLCLFKNAINQFGPWQDQNLNIDENWYLEQLKNKIMATDWPAAGADVSRFLSLRDRQQLSLWGQELFIDRVNKMESYLALPRQ